MDFSFGTLQLDRTHPAHVGTQPLTDTHRRAYLDRTGTVSNSVPLEPKARGAFESYLFEALDAMNSQQVSVGKMQEQIITDPDSVDIHDVTTAMAKAQMSMNLAHTIITRLVSGWNEISTTR
ncbi:MAG: flagellar hook-basal body complex protein FliE [Treponema sp.]|nr:flagellar hook-basal body complex protein FliE [Treponema sp.]